MNFYEGCTKEEIEVYKELQNEPFDFGSGLIIPKNGGEEAYYEMALECLEHDDQEIFGSSKEYIEQCFEEIELEFEFDSYKKDMTRAKRRKKNWSKAIRNKKNGTKSMIKREINYYNKNKNFCSCGQCQMKTNSKKPFISTGHTIHGMKHEYFSNPNWKPSDKRKIDCCNHKINDYENNEHFDYWKWYWMEEAHTETEIQEGKADRDIVFDYINNTEDDVLILHDGTISYKEKPEDWFRRIGHDTGYISKSYVNYLKGR